MTSATSSGGAAPLALVLAGGGARAAYQVGVLAAITERRPALEIPILTGVSAGAINTIYLAAHPGPVAAAVRGLADEWRGLRPDRVYCVRPVRLVRSGLRWLVQQLVGRSRGPTTLRGILDMQPLRQFLAGCVELAGIDASIASGRLRAVALSATAYGSGQTVTFVHGAPDIPAWQRAQRYAVHARLTLDHVLASAAIPLFFPAVRLGDEFFGDGSVRQRAPLAPAIHLGARAVLAIGMRAARPAREPTPVGDYPSAAEVMGLLFHSVFLDALETDAERLDRVNRVLAALPSGTAAPDGLRPVRLLLLRPSRDLGALAAGFGVNLPPLIRLMVRALGGGRARAADFISYLLFEPGYTTRLMELGYEDGQTQWPKIEEFLGD